MASFFDNFANKMNEFGNKVVTVTTNSTENIRLTNSIKDEERQIANDYKEIGMKYRELFGEAPAPEFAALLQDIAKREILISEYRKKVLQNKGKVTCSSCGTEIESSCAFCTKCGTKNPVAEEIARAKAEAAAQAAASKAANEQAETIAASAAETEPAPTSTPAAENSESLTSEIVCKNCGNPIAEGNVFCTNCGTRQDA